VRRSTAAEQSASFEEEKVQKRAFFFLNFFPKPYTLNPKKTQNLEKKKKLSLFGEMRDTR
jgi:hypothetical protein